MCDHGNSCAFVTMLSCVLFWGAVQAIGKRALVHNACCCTHQIHNALAEQTCSKVWWWPCLPPQLSPQM